MTEVKPIVWRQFFKECVYFSHLTLHIEEVKHYNFSLVRTQEDGRCLSREENWTILRLFLFLLVYFFSCSNAWPALVLLACSSHFWRFGRHKRWHHTDVHGRHWQFSQRGAGKKVNHWSVDICTRNVRHFPVRIILKIALGTILVGN